jgi:hypothetical protein
MVEGLVFGEGGPAEKLTSNHRKETTISTDTLEV